MNVVPGAEEGVTVTLSLLRSTLCSRLHVDHTSARMMVTYYGPRDGNLRLRANERGDREGERGWWKFCDRRVEGVGGEICASDRGG